jgi:hypothetical protein
VAPDSDLAPRERTDAVHPAPQPHSHLASALWPDTAWPDQTKPEHRVADNEAKRNDFPRKIPLPIHQFAGIGSANFHLGTEIGSRCAVSIMVQPSIELSDV